jgi:hypothetical protein
MRRRNFLFMQAGWLGLAPIAALKAQSSEEGAPAAKPGPVLLSFNQSEVEEGYSERGSLQPDGSLWVGARCIIDERGSVKVGAGDLHVVLKSLSESVEIANDVYTAGNTPIAVIEFAVRKPQG